MVAVGGPWGSAPFCGTPAPPPPPPPPLPLPIPRTPQPSSTTGHPCLKTPSPSLTFPDLPCAPLTPAVPSVLAFGCGGGGEGVDWRRTRCAPCTTRSSRSSVEVRVSTRSLSCMLYSGRKTCKTHPSMSHTSDRYAPCLLVSHFVQPPPQQARASPTPQRDTCDTQCEFTQPQREV